MARTVQATSGSTTITREKAGALRPRGASQPGQARHGDPLNGAALTLVLALYPLVGAVTVVLAALLLAGGALAG